MSLFLILAASLSCLPLIHSVARLGKECVVSIVRNAQMTSTTLCHHALSNLEEAIAEPQPKVLNLASTIFPSSSTF